MVVGAGFAGLYAVYRLRGAGFTVRAFEAGDDVGGTWYWNRYPGARVDIPSVDYMYSFDPDWRDGWQWSEKYATQPEILGYLNHVADKFDLRREIEFGTRVEQARFEDATSVWRVRTRRRRGRQLPLRRDGHRLPVDTQGTRYRRAWISSPVRSYFTNRWPHDGVDFTGKRVAVIGTGSSGIQSIPLIAEQASELVVFQRTPCFSMPAHNGPTPAERLARLRRRGGLSRRGATVPRRGSDGAQHHPDLLGVRGRTPTAVRTPLGDRRTTGGAQCLRRCDDQPGRQRRACRFLPRTRSAAMVARPADRRRCCAPPTTRSGAKRTVPRYELLRHVQPAPRAPGRPATRTRYERSPRPE